MGDELQLAWAQPLIGEIYVWASLSDLHRNSVLKRYGSYCMELVEEMVRKDLLRAVNKNVFTLSPRAPIFDSRTIKLLGSHFVSRFADPARSAERGQNALAFFAESLNQAGKNEWLKIDEQSFYKKWKSLKIKTFRVIKRSSHSVSPIRRSMRVRCSVKSFMMAFLAVLSSVAFAGCTGGFDVGGSRPMDPFFVNPDAHIERPQMGNGASTFAKTQCG
jgi:hypothetical protein